ncbi:MAG TPA: hypothetical protein VMF90_22195 [Rhizobiaceae bacterium]|nr:hypothetical protein [Rhizobiaceae bacterium]
MDSLGYIDERNEMTDVIIGASHGAPCATHLVVPWRPRGVIVHDAGIGFRDGGVAGLTLLQEYLIPGAAVEAMSARISDAQDMYDNGVISRANKAAGQFGVVPGMKASEAAQRLLNEKPQIESHARRQIIVHDSDIGRVVALDTVKYADARIDGSVLCMGSHAARSMPRYLAALGVDLAGVITNDCGKAKDDSGIAGLAALDEVGTAAATASHLSARVGDARSTYFNGRVSAANETARKLGAVIGQPVRELAELMLLHRKRIKGR